MAKFARIILVAIAVLAWLPARGGAATTIAPHYETIINPEGNPGGRIFGDLYLKVSEDGSITGQFRKFDGAGYGPDFEVSGGTRDARIWLQIGFLGTLTISATLVRDGVIDGVASLDGHTFGFHAVATSY